MHCIYRSFYDAYLQIVNNVYTYFKDGNQKESDFLMVDK